MDKCTSAQAIILCYRHPAKNREVRRVPLWAYAVPPYVDFCIMM